MLRAFLLHGSVKGPIDALSKPLGLQPAQQFGFIYGKSVSHTGSRTWKDDD